jgi:hypothetical protein
VLDTITVRARGDKVESPVRAGVNPQAVEDKRVTDEEFERIIATESFAKYYAFAVEHVAHDNGEYLEETRGEWRFFDTGSDPVELTNTLQGQGTGWCTAGTATATKQLAQGNFHIYYSLNKLGVPTIPRVAIYRKGGHISEVRGVAYKQNLDPYILPRVKEKLGDFGEDGQKYQQAFADTEHLADIHVKHSAGEELTPDELRFLYQLDSNITGFGHEEDPRINKIIFSRDGKKDIETIFGTTEPNELVSIFCGSEQLQRGSASNFLMQLDHLNHHSLELLMKNGYAWFVAGNINRKFNSPDYVKVAAALIQMGDEELANGNEYTRYYRLLIENLPNFNRLDHARLIEQLLKRDEASGVLQYLHHFQGINHITLVEQVLETEDGGLWLATYLPHLHGVNHTHIMRKLLERDELHLVAEKVHNFTGINHVRLAKLLIDRGEHYWLERNLENFEGLTPEIIAAAKNGTDLAGVRFEKVKLKTSELLDDMYWKLFR